MAGGFQSSSTLFQVSWFVIVGRTPGIAGVVVFATGAFLFVSLAPRTPA